jgi:hypothetical protein
MAESNRATKLAEVNSSAGIESVKAKFVNFRTDLISVLAGGIGLLAGGIRLRFAEADSVPDDSGLLPSPHGRHPECS